ncbi:ABC transporter ATP-binding protein [Egibacter rhizosphaerae]|nr:ABC transporter ATP-binding protein [Egibacter rhizosphaerae]
MSRVELRNVDKWFDDTQVLFDVSFTAEEGEFVVLLGPSGCGKSTSLRLLAGLEDAGSGEIRIGDRVVNELPAAARGIAMVFQNYALFPHLSVQENILFGLKVRRVEKSDRADRLRRTSELLGLTEYLDRKPAQLSGGQRQRVALGRALVSGSSVILMDEPLSNLDAKLRQQMRLELRSLQRELGLTVVYVTHDQVEAMTMADRVVVMRDGAVDQDADPRTLYQAPARAEVARFIGSPPMNLMDGSATGGHVEIAASGVTIEVDRPDELVSEVLVGIRPEDIELEGRGIALPARVTTTELLGADQLVRLDVGGAHELIARLHPSTPAEPGHELTLHLPASAIHLFDARDGRRLAVQATAPSASGTSHATKG